LISSQSFIKRRKNNLILGGRALNVKVVSKEGKVKEKGLKAHVACDRSQARF
jgi:hypothetical protein